jgi:hypothetical protein
MAGINIDKLAVEVMGELDLYLGNTVETVSRAVEETAEETVEELNRTSPKGATGEYAKSWDHKRDPGIKGKYRLSRVVYANKPDYRLTHLLENDHAKVNGGRVKGKPHIRKAEENAETRLMAKLARNLRDGGG